MSVAIVTDSSGSLPTHLRAALGISVVPLRFTIGDEEYRSGDLDHARSPHASSTGRRPRLPHPLPATSFARSDPVRRSRACSC